MVSNFKILVFLCENENFRVDFFWSEFFGDNFLKGFLQSLLFMVIHQSSWWFECMIHGYLVHDPMIMIYEKLWSYDPKTKTKLWSHDHDLPKVMIPWSWSEKSCDPMIMILIYLGFSHEHMIPLIPLIVNSLNSALFNIWIRKYN